MAVLSPLRIWRGETKVYRFTIWQVADDSRLNLAVYDGLEFQVKSDTGAADPALISKTLGAGIAVLTQSGDTIGQLEVTLNPTDTGSLAEGVYKYDLWGIIGSARYLLARPADFSVEAAVNGV